jgi:hypothetical protein
VSSPSCRLSTTKLVEVAEYPTPFVLAGVAQIPEMEQRCCSSEQPIHCIDDGREVRFRSGHTLLRPSLHSLDRPLTIHELEGLGAEAIKTVGAVKIARRSPALIRSGIVILIADMTEQRADYRRVGHVWIEDEPLEIDPSS